MGNQSVLGPTGPGSLVGVNLLPGATPATGSVATVELLTGDGTVAQVALPTTAGAVQQGLAPVGTLAGTVLGAPTGEAVTQLTNGLAPAVATVTSTAGQITTPLLGTVNGALSPITEPLAGDNGVLAPVTGLAENAVGTLGGVSADPSAALNGSLVGANVGGNALTGASPAQTVAGVNLLPSDSGAVTGQLATVSVLSQGNLADVALPITATAVEAGLQPGGTLAGGLLGPQVETAVSQVSSAVAPVVAPVTSTVDSVAAPLLDTVNSLAPTLPGGAGIGNALAPATGSGSATAPVTGALGGLLGGSN